MQINELFDSKYQYQWIKRDDHLWGGSFRTKNRHHVELSILKISNDNEWDIAFTRNTSNSDTGEGDQIRIFATIVAMIREFDSSEAPSKLTFIGYKGDNGSESRLQLYRRMCKYFSNTFKYSEQDRDYKVKFVLVRKSINDLG